MHLFLRREELSRGKRRAGPRLAQDRFSGRQVSEIFDRRLIPAYFLKLGAVVYFVVFPDFRFYRGGVVLNDERGFGPEHVFKIDLGRRG